MRPVHECPCCTCGTIDRTKHIDPDPDSVEAWIGVLLGGVFLTGFPRALTPILTKEASL